MSVTATSGTDVIPVCPRCEHPHVTPKGKQACAAHRKTRDPNTGALRPCTQPPVRGADKCHMHGNARGTKGREAADRRVKAGRVGREIQRLAAASGDTAAVRGLDELSGALWEARLWCAHLTERAGELDALHADGRAHVVMQLLGEWQDRRARFAKWIIEAGVDEAQMRLLDSEAHCVLLAVFAALDDPQLLDALAAGDRERARRLVGRHLRELGPGDGMTV